MKRKIDVSAMLSYLAWIGISIYAWLAFFRFV